MPPLLIAAALLLPPAPEPAGAAEPLAAWDFGPADDRDFDRWPDGWLRRRGPGFPHFVPLEIDRNAPGGGALWAAANGGGAAAYAPPAPLTDRAAVRLTGRVRTDRLAGHAAVVSLSLLDANRVRLARFLSGPVSGTSPTGGVAVTIGPVPPVAGAAWAVVGTHLVPGDGVSVGGGAWWDDLTLSREPFLALERVAAGPLAAPGEAVAVRVSLSGLPRGAAAPVVSLTVTNADDPAATPAVRPVPLAWGEEGEATAAATLPGRPVGLWAVTAAFPHGGGDLSRRVTVAVADPADLPIDPAAAAGRFGWSLPAAPAGDPGALADAAAAAGAGWVLWTAGGRNDESFALAARSRGLRPAARLAAERFGGGPADALPDALAAAADPAAAVRAVVAPLAAHVRHWRLGRDDEPGPLAAHPGPTVAGLVRAAAPAVVTAGSPVTGADREAVAGDAPAPPGAWRTVPGDKDPDAFAWALVTAAAAGEGPVFAADAAGASGGVLTADGSPTRRFLPFRTVAALLGRGRFLGRVRLPVAAGTAEPTALAFVTTAGPVLCLRGEEPAFADARLGGTPAGRDAVGRTIEVRNLPDGLHRVGWSARPSFLTGIGERPLRFRLGTTLAGGGMLNSTPDPQTLTVAVANPDPTAAAVTVAPEAPRGWALDPPAAEVALPPGGVGAAAFRVELPPHVSLGHHPLTVRLRFAGTGPDGEATGELRVPRTVRVRLAGLRLDVTDRRLPGGGWEVTQTLTQTLLAGEAPAFRCDLQVPGAARVSRRTGPLGPGAHTLTHRLPASAREGEIVWLRCAEVSGPRVLNRRWPLGSPPSPSPP